MTVLAPPDFRPNISALVSAKTAVLGNLTTKVRRFSSRSNSKTRSIQPPYCLTVSWLASNCTDLVICSRVSFPPCHASFLLGIPKNKNPHRPSKCWRFSRSHLGIHIWADRRVDRYNPR